MSSNHKEEIFTKFEIVKKSNDHQSLEEEISNSSHNSQDIKEEHNQIEVCSKTPSSSEEDEEEEEEEKLKKKNEDEEEDGFRTPTSLDHKISVITCPQAPKKIKVQSLKRKAAGSCRQLPLDLSKEVELLFSPTHHSQSHRAKKIRRDDNKEQK
ncbi:hypothetical protein P8452_59773 [Trifolium repens]|nr:hypothetical protein P8452_59773 [Trifolium repens]